MGVSVSRDSVIDCRPREGKVVGVKQVGNITYQASNWRSCNCGSHIHVCAQ